jgi:hypothetical protein
VYTGCVDRSGGNPSEERNFAMKLYKLTDENGQTKNHTQWGENISHSASGDSNQDLCSNGWIHAYESSLLAAADKTLDIISLAKKAVSEP